MASAMSSLFVGGIFLNLERLRTIDISQKRRSGRKSIFDGNYLGLRVRKINRQRGSKSAKGKFGRTAAHWRDAAGEQISYALEAK
jgi:hypothetical protein